MNISILHISDLHRDLTYGIRNGPLVRSLLRDRDRYVAETPAIRTPDLIVVSGDIVYGVPATQDAPLDEINRQYAEAETLLADLAVELLDGDRSRIVIVPGNHDVCLHHVLRSLSPARMEEQSNRQRLAALFTPYSRLRWSWKDLSLSEIKDQAEYANRLKPFADFYARFYEGRRTYSLTPESQFDIFDYRDFNVVFAAFNSCCNNDLFNRAALIHPDTIASATRTLSTTQYIGRIQLAVWHHNTSGGPHVSDYLDADTLQVLIDCGFSVGLHGHQHRSDFIDEQFKFGSGRKITVLSAGTLCGGEHSLPHGSDRSYNILQINTESLEATVHQRRMVNHDFASPIWMAGWFPEYQRSYVSFSVQPPLNPGSSIGRLAEAEKLLSAQDYKGAKSLLLPLAGADQLARRLLLECYSSIEYDEDFVKTFDPPTSTGEAVPLADALWACGDRARLAALLQTSFVQNSKDPAIVALRIKYEMRLGKR